MSAPRWGRLAALSLVLASLCHGGTLPGSAPAAAQSAPAFGQLKPVMAPSVVAGAAPHPAPPAPGAPAAPAPLAMPLGQPPQDPPINLTSAEIGEASQDAANVIGGFTESFFGGSEADLSAREVHCLAKGAGMLAGEMLSTAGRSAETLMVMKQSTDTLQPKPLAGPGVAPVAAKPAINPMIAGMEITTQVASIMKSEDKLADQCLNPAAKAAVQRAVHHLSNARYFEGHLLANGVNIMDELTSAAAKFDTKDFRGFGDDLGKAGRKVLLSHKGDGLGANFFREPTPEELERASTGLIDSIFGGNSAPVLELKSDQITTMAPPPYPGNTPAPNGQPPALVPWELLPAEDIKLDMRKCVTENTGLFKKAWKPIFNIMEMAGEKMAEGESVDANSLKEGGAIGAEGFGSLAMSMLDVQMALRHCGLSEQQETVLWDSIEAGHGMAMRLNTATPGAKPDSVADVAVDVAAPKLTQALEDWKDHKMYEFGTNLGKVFRKTVLTKFEGGNYVTIGGADPTPPPQPVAAPSPFAPPAAPAQTPPAPFAAGSPTGLWSSREPASSLSPAGRAGFVLVMASMGVALALAGGVTLLRALRMQRYDSLQAQQSVDTTVAAV